MPRPGDGGQSSVTKSTDVEESDVGSTESQKPENQQIGRLLRSIVYQLLEFVDLIFMPILFIIFLTGCEIFAPVPLPYFSLQPFSINFAQNGLLLTTFFKGVITLDLLFNLYEQYQENRARKLNRGEK